MIDHSQDIFEQCSDKLRETFSEINIIGRELSDKPTLFPAVSIIQSSNTVNQSYSTLSTIEIGAIESYKFEVCSNLEPGREKQVKAIISVIDEVMNMNGYVRTFCQPVSNIDVTIARTIVRYENKHSFK